MAGFVNTPLDVGNSNPVPCGAQVREKPYSLPLYSVTTLAFGVESAGSGLILLDDILLYKTAPAISEPAEGSDTSLVGH